MLTKDPTVFQTSSNPRELVNMAKLYARSPDPADQMVLFGQLDSDGFLNKLNTPEQYIALDPRSLDVAGVVRTLMDQDHAAASATVVRLIDSKAFQARYPLVELNIRALASDRPACPKTIAYWDRQSQPDSSNIDIVMDAIFENGSEPALQLFQRKMNEDGQDPLRQLSWLRDPLLRHRNDLNVLTFCERMLVDQTLALRWHSPLLEAIFDYNERWYNSCKFPRPPARVAASPDAKQAMGRIGEHAIYDMQVQIPGLTSKIKLELEKIGYDWKRDDQQA